jgi:hypothetical protein
VNGDVAAQSGGAWRRPVLVLSVHDGIAVPAIEAARFPGTKVCSALAFGVRSVPILSLASAG